MHVVLDPHPKGSIAEITLVIATPKTAGKPSRPTLPVRAPIQLPGFWFLVCYAATQTHVNYLSGTPFVAFFLSLFESRVFIENC